MAFQSIWILKFLAGVTAIAVIILYYYGVIDAETARAVLAAIIAYIAGNWEGYHFGKKIGYLKARKEH